MTFTCCRSTINSEKDFENHFKFHFNFTRYGAFTCKIDHCNTLIDDYYSLKKHFFRAHYDLIKQVFSSETINRFRSSEPEKSDNVFNFNEDLNDFSLDFQNEPPSNQPTNDSIQNLADQFSIVSEQLIEQPEQPENFDLSEQISELIIHCKSSLKINEASVISLLTGYNQILLKSNPNSVTIDKSTILTVNQFVKNRYQLRKTVLRSQNNSSDCYTYEMQIDENTHKFYYCPIVTAINRFLKNDNLFNKLLIEHHRNPDLNVLRTFKDGSLYSNQTHYANIIELQLQIYFDDISLTQRGRNNNLSVISGSFNNLPLKDMAKTSDMFLILITSRPDLDKITLSCFLKPLFDEIKEFNEANHSFHNYLLQLKLTTCIGDLKAIHELIDFRLGFLSDSCRVCTISYSQLNESFLSYFEARPESLALRINNNAFEGFMDSVYNFVMDTFHDSSEAGQIDKLFSTILKKYYYKQTSVLMEKLKSIKSVRHGKIEGFIEGSDFYRLKGNGMQKFEFFILFPILDNRLLRDSVDWKLILLLREILLFYFCDTIYKKDLNEIQNKVIEFQKLYFDNFVKTGIDTFTFKIHNLYHYKEYCEQVGPLRAQCTLKGERFLKQIKDSVKNSRNTINLPFSTMLNYKIYHEPNLFKINDSFKILESIETNQENQDFFKDYAPFIDLNKKFFELGYLKISGLEFKKGLVYVLGYENSNRNKYPIFIKITRIFKQESVAKIIGEVLRVISYNSFFCSFVVENIKQLEQLDVDNLACPKWLYYFESDNCYILNDFQSKADYHSNQQMIFF